MRHRVMRIVVVKGFWLGLGVVGGVRVTRVLV